MIPLVETEDMNPSVKIAHYLYEYCMLQYSSKNKRKLNVFTRLTRMSDISSAVINKKKQFRRSDGNQKGENSIHHSPARYSHSSETVRDYLSLFCSEILYFLTSPVPREGEEFATTFKNTSSYKTLYKTEVQIGFDDRLKSAYI